MAALAYFVPRILACSSICHAELYAQQDMREDAWAAVGREAGLLMGARRLLDSLELSRGAAGKVSVSVISLLIGSVTRLSLSDVDHTFDDETAVEAIRMCGDALEDIAITGSPSRNANYSSVSIWRELEKHQRSRADHPGLSLFLERVPVAKDSDSWPTAASQCAVQIRKLGAVPGPAGPMIYDKLSNSNLSFR